MDMKNLDAPIMEFLSFCLTFFHVFAYVLDKPEIPALGLIWYEGPPARPWGGWGALVAGALEGPTPP